MSLTREFLVAELESLDAEIKNASNFIVKAQAVHSAFQMLINRWDAPEPEQEEENDNAV